MMGIGFLMSIVRHLFGFLHGMSAELIAERREHSSGKVFFVTAGKTHLQGKGNDRGGHIEVYGFKDCPAAFA